MVLGGMSMVGIVYRGIAVSGSDVGGGRKFGDPVRALELLELRRVSHDGEGEWGREMRGSSGGDNKCGT